MKQKCIYCPTETESHFKVKGFTKPVPVCYQCARLKGLTHRDCASVNNEEQLIPDHYNKGVQPWDLERVMESSGDAFVDARRTDAIEYCFRKKDNMLEDLQKARHCLDAAIEQMKKRGIQ